MRQHGASSTTMSTGWGTHCWCALLNLLSCHKAVIELRSDDLTGAVSAQTVRQMLPSTQTAIVFTIDATTTGNIARFFNHRCGGGNLEPVIVRTAGSMLPHVAMFASEDIRAGEELTFAYGDSAAAAALAAPDTKWRRCCCGTKSCLGYLPRNA